MSRLPMLSLLCALLVPHPALADPGTSGLFDHELRRLHSDEVVKLAERFAGGRLVATLEGGYELEALGASVEAHLKALLD